MLEIHCEDRSIHLSTKMKKISCSSQDYKEDIIRGLLQILCSSQKHRIVFTIQLLQIYIFETLSIV